MMRIAVLGAKIRSDAVKNFLLVAISAAPLMNYACPLAGAVLAIYRTAAANSTAAQ